MKMQGESYGSFGLDVSDAFIRAVQLDARNAIRSYGEAALPKGTVRRGRIVDVAAFCGAVRQLVASMHGTPISKRSWTFAALTDTCVLIRQFDFPSGTRGGKLRKLIRARFEEEFPFIEEERYLNWETLDQVEKHGPVTVLATLTAKKAMDEYVSALQACGLRLAGMQATSIATANALVPGGLAGGDPGARAAADGTVFVDCREGLATLTFFDLGSVQFVLSVEGSMLAQDGLLGRIRERLLLGADWYERSKNSRFRKVAAVGLPQVVSALIQGLRQDGRFEAVEGDHLANLDKSASAVGVSSVYTTAIGLALRSEL